jgi:predicted ATP-binding protein involved in virulence
VLFLYFKDYKEKIILIDEPEISLHPSWQNHILKIYENFAKKYDSQVIIATHSPQIIGSAKPESLRILNKRKDGKIEVIDNYSKSYGLEVNKILLDIMGMSETRTPDVDKEIKYIKEQIYTNNFFDNEEFKNRWDDLEKALGKNDLDLKLLKLEMKMREKRNVSNK